MSKHTPGPWIVEGPHDAPWVSTADHRTILPQTVADACLIAAAPDMLDVLRAVAKHFKDTDVPLGSAARAIIAKVDA